MRYPEDEFEELLAKARLTEHYVVAQKALALLTIQRLKE